MRHLMSLIVHVYGGYIFIVVILVLAVIWSRTKAARHKQESEAKKAAYETFSSEGKTLVGAAVRRGRKSVWAAYFAWILIGSHYAYLGRWGDQVVFWFTFGRLIVGWVVDFFRIPGMVQVYNEEVEARAMRDFGYIGTTPQQSHPTTPIPPASPTPAPISGAQSFTCDHSGRRVFVKGEELCAACGAKVAGRAG